MMKAVSQVTVQVRSMLPRRQGSVQQPAEVVREKMVEFNWVQENLVKHSYKGKLTYFKDHHQEQKKMRKTILGIC